VWSAVVRHTSFPFFLPMSRPIREFHMPTAAPTATSAGTWCGRRASDGVGPGLRVVVGSIGPKMDLVCELVKPQLGTELEQRTTPRALPFQIGELLGDRDIES